MKICVTVEILPDTFPSIEPTLNERWAAKVRFSYGISKAAATHSKVGLHNMAHEATKDLYKDALALAIVDYVKSQEMLKKE